MPGRPAAQTSTHDQRNPIADIFGALFGDRVGVNHVDRIPVGRRPDAARQPAGQFVKPGRHRSRAGSLKSGDWRAAEADYYELVELEARYGADRRFTTRRNAPRWPTATAT
jgi:hypothetical protein